MKTNIADLLLFTYAKRMSRILYLDQNAWVALARGAWDEIKYPNERAALDMILKAIRHHDHIVPLSFTNIYETTKINDPIRRTNMAYTQACISGGCVFRGRRRIIDETLTAYLKNHFKISSSFSDRFWFLSYIWFESVFDYSSKNYEFEISDFMIQYIKSNSAESLFEYLLGNDDDIRIESVRRFSSSSIELIEKIEARRKISSCEPMAMRRRVYGANLIIDEIDCIIDSGCKIGLNWKTVSDIGSSLIRKFTVDIPIFNVERELAIKLEDQTRPISENDLRDLVAFSTVLPFADVIIAEKPFVNLARQAGLGERYGTKLLTSIFDFSI